MPKYKLSPEEREAERQRKEQIRGLLTGLEIKDFSDIQSLFKEMVGEVLENGLEGELDDELGYSKYDYRNKETANSRNGHSKKTLKTSYGEVGIKVPRDRSGEFEPQLVKKQQTTLSGDIEEKIISMYAKSCSNYSKGKNTEAIRIVPIIRSAMTVSL
jgi:transposase-like protein